MPARRIPNLRSQLLGKLLRERREAVRIKLADAGEHIQRDQSSMSRMESGHQLVRVPDLHALLRFYDVTDRATVDAMEKLSREVFRKAWWDEYADALKAWVVDFPWLEERSRTIRSYDALLPCGLLQTRGFAEAAIRAVGPRDKAWVERTVEFRMARQRVLEQEKPPNLSVIIDESVLRRLAGGSPVMQTQLEHLAEAATRPNIEIRVLPVSVGLHPGLAGAFQIFEMPDLMSDVAWSETLSGALYVESDSVVRYRRGYDDLHKLAKSPEQSRRLILDAAKDMR